MSGTQRIGGPVEIQVGGVRLSVKAGTSYNLGVPKRSSVMGSKQMEGYKEEPQPAFVEFVITDKRTTDVKALQKMEDVTLTMTVPNGKTILLHNAFHAGEGTITTDEGEIASRFESAREGEEI